MPQHPRDQLGLRVADQPTIGFDGNAAATASSTTPDIKITALGSSWMMLDALAILIAVFIGHDHVSDHYVGRLLLESPRERRARHRGRDHVDVLGASDLDHLPHASSSRR